MRQNNDISRVLRLQAAVTDTIADYAQTVQIYRLGVYVADAAAIVDASPRQRLNGTGSATFRFLYTLYLRLPVDVQVNDSLLAGAHYYLVHDINFDVSLRSAAACLCERMAAGP